MNITVTTTSSEVNWLLGKVQHTTSEEFCLDKSAMIHTWAFRGQLPPKMVKKIHYFISTLKQTQKTYGDRVMVDGYELWFADIPPVSRPWDGYTHLIVSLEEPA